MFTSNSSQSQIYCSKCHTNSLSSIQIKRKKDTNKFYIHITCINNHNEETPLSQFDMINKKMYIKQCSKCNQNIGIKKIFYCFKCKVYFCINCPCEHFTKDKDSVSSYFGLLESRCSLHNKMQEFYCLTCSKNLCKICCKNHSLEHKNVVNLMEKFTNYQKMLKGEITKEKELVEKYNDIINKTRKILNQNIQYRRYILNLKKSIVNSYQNNKLNYFNIQNINFAKNEINNALFYDQDKIKKLYEFCRGRYVSKINDNN